MPQFIFHGLDKPGALALRMATREAHLAYVAQNKAAVPFASPLLDEAGDMVGSLIALDLPDRAAAERWHAEDPYTKAGLWQSVDIKVLRIAVGPA